MSDLKDKQLAPPSPKVQKTKEKLKKMLMEIDASITPVALERKMKEIRRWIARNAHERVPLSKKEISLFDENANPAHASVRINKISTILASKIGKVSVGK